MIHCVQLVHLFIDHRENGIDTNIDFSSKSLEWRMVFCPSTPAFIIQSIHTEIALIQLMVSIKDGRFTVETGAEISLLSFEGNFGNPGTSEYSLGKLSSFFEAVGRSSKVL